MLLINPIRIAKCGLTKPQAGVIETRLEIAPVHRAFKETFLDLLKAISISIQVIAPVHAAKLDTTTAFIDLALIAPPEPPFV